MPLLVAVRGADDNALAGWRMVFSVIDAGPVFLLVFAGIGIAFWTRRSGIVLRAPVLVLPMLAAAAVLPLWREPEMVLDASRYFLQAKHLELEGVGSFFRHWGSTISAWTDLPLVPALYGVLFRAFCESRIPVQAFTTLLFSLTVLLTYLAGNRLYDRETGANAGLLLLAMPYLLVQVPLMLVDVPAMFFIALALYALMRALDTGGAGRILVASLALGAALFSKYSAPLMLLVLPVLAAVYPPQDRAAVRGRFLAVVLPAAALMLVVAAAQHDLVRQQLALLTSYQLPGLRRWQESVVSSFFFQIHPLVSVSAVAGAWNALRSRDFRFLVPGWFAFFVICIQHERIRYFLPLLPLFALMASRGISRLPGRNVRQYFVHAVVATSLVIVCAGYVPFFRQSTMANLQQAGRFLDSLDADTVEVRAVAQTASTGNTEMAIPLLDLFTSKRIVYRRTNAVRPDDRIVASAPLRFSWETPLPGFYEPPPQTCLPVVVISPGRETDPFPGSPPGDRPQILARFPADTGTFRYRCSVTVFKETCLDETGQ